MAGQGPLHNDEHIQFGSLILKNSGDMAASVFYILSDDNVVVHGQKVQLYAFIASLRSELHHESTVE